MLGRYYLHFGRNWSNMSDMKITLNGQMREFKDGQTLNQVITLSSKNTTRVIAEVNGEIIKSTMWHNIALREGDRVELVAFVGGG
jgi:thiamine biosynthesis protein ThiS